MKHLARLLRLVAVLVCAPALLAGTVLVVAPQAVALLTSGSSRLPELNLSALGERSLMFARDGTLIASLHDYESNRAPVRLDQVPEALVQTVLAVEDEHFYEHGGVNLRATARALMENVEAGGIAQGGSTITQQVVKNALLSPEQDLGRKVKEAVYAVRLEDEMSKDEILERYLNTVYFGNGAYGVQAAAETYFGLNVGDLNWGQAALLAGLIRNPGGYDPFLHPEAAESRRRFVLDRLVGLGRITQYENELYQLVPLPTANLSSLPPPKDYFIEEVKQQLLDDPRLGETATDRFNAVFRGGLRIYTTIDPIYQYVAAQARNDVQGTITTPCPRPDGTLGPCFLPEAGGLFTSAVISVEPGTGAVRAMIGGPGFEAYKYNLTTQGIGRQAGSSFKTFVLVSALEHGYIPNDVIDGSGPCKFPNPGGTPDPYEVDNFDDNRGSVGTITRQTVGSVNCAYVRLEQLVGLPNVIDTARRMGITTPLGEPTGDLSLTLGTREVHPIEMAAAYATLAADGVYRQPYLIDRVEDSRGRVIFEHEDDPQQALDPEVARLATEVLEANVQYGTGTAAQLGEQAAAGKTGTAQDSADAWFVGYTPQLATAVWMGAPEGRIPMRNVGGRTVTGGSYPARIWGLYMSEVHSGLPITEFTPPEPPDRAGRFLRLDPEIDLGASGYDEFAAQFAPRPPATYTFTPPPVRPPVTFAPPPPPTAPPETRPPRPPRPPRPRP
ncbi:MAG TPA: transglycosylase domain-containing protein [Acidimicrobiales bacterium]